MSNEKINILCSLALNCPFNLKCANCPFRVIREIYEDDRFDYLGNFKSTEIDEIIKNITNILLQTSIMKRGSVVHFCNDLTNK